MSNHAIVEEAKSIVQQMEDSRRKLEHISGEHALMKRLIIEKNKKILEQREKIEELVRLIVLSDKMLSEMKEKIYLKEEKISRMSEKLKTLAGGQDRQLAGFKSLVEFREKQVKKLATEKEGMHAKLAALLEAYENAKERLKEVSQRLMEISKNASSALDKEAISRLRNEVEGKDAQLKEISRILSESQQKIRGLEESNRKLGIRHEQEKEVLSRVIRNREEEIRKLKSAVKEAVRAERPAARKNVREIKINVPKTFDAFERKELESMIKIAVSHGDSVEKIKESLLNAGYEKEKINEIIRYA